MGSLANLLLHFAKKLETDKRQELVVVAESTEPATELVRDEERRITIPTFSFYHEDV